MVILSSALTTSVVPPALANSASIATSTIIWPTAALDNGVISGGAPRNYLTGTEGWGLAPLSSAGSMGMEWTSPHDPARREPFFGTLQESSITPGGLSSWSTAGLLSPRPEQNFFATIATRAEHNELAWTIDLLALDEDAMAPNRFYWVADLAPGYQAVYSSSAPGQLVITDASNTHPTLVFQATTTAGTLRWGGGEIYTDALANGEQNPTLYIYGTSAMDMRISITLGIIEEPKPEPDPVPEPEPAPEPEPVPEPEPAPAPEPEPETEPVPEPDPVVDPEPSPGHEAEALPVESAPEEPLVEQVPPVPAEEPATVSAPESAPADAPAIAEAPTLVELREAEPAALPEPAFLPSEPVEIPLTPREPRKIGIPETLSPPEPSFAGAWLGLSLMASLAAGGLIAALRRWRNQMAE